MFDRNMRWSINNWILLLIYAVFIIASCLYLRGWLKYRGVESWPSVSAKIVGGGGSLHSIQTQNRYGGSDSITMDSSIVEFEYSIDGQTYRSKTATPDGGGLPMIAVNEPWKAFYKPSSPDVAVISPVPYFGVGPMLTAAFTGIIVLVHFWCTVLDLLTKRKHAGKVATDNS